LSQGDAAAAAASASADVNGTVSRICSRDFA